MVFFFLKLIKRPAFWLGCAFIVPSLRDAPELVNETYTMGFAYAGLKWGYQINNIIANIYLGI